jgi:hypothetical protein
MREGSTTVRVSRRTHQILSDLAERTGRSVSDLLDHLAESARRREILDQYNTRMGELLRDPDERATWQQETVRSEVSAAELMREDTAPGGEDAAAVPG